MNKNKTFNKWKDLIDTKLKYSNAPWGEKEVVYFRRALGLAGMKDRDKALELRFYFDEVMPFDGYNITVEHQQKGINYLRDNTFKKNGQLRKNNIFGQSEIDIINNYKEFKFVGLIDVRGYYLPIYRCIAENGDYFDYTGTMYSMIEILDFGTLNLRAV